MPLKDEHLEKAKHNEKLAASLGVEYNDWRVISMYYASLHYIEMQLAVESSHPKSHDNRDDIIAKHHLLKNVWSPYSKLSKLSRNARYYSYKITDSDVNNAKTWLRDIKTYLISIGHKQITF